MNRRKILSWLSLSWIAGGVSVLIGACTKQSSSSTAPAPEAGTNRDGFIKVGQIQDLDQSGRILRPLTNNQKVLIIQDAKDVDRLYAFNPTCTHQGCPVDWNQDSQEIFCACHGSTYASSGTVIKGPANEPLESYDVMVSGEAILVKPTVS